MERCSFKNSKAAHTLRVPKLVVIGGGAAGFFGAISAAEAGVDEVLILEKGPEVLTKVRISGGGRCNVTHHCFEPRELVTFYPRGHKSLMGPFHRWQASDTIAWFESHGVALKTEADGRMFPTTDDSRTIIDCLMNTARDLRIDWHTHCAVTGIRALPEGGFEVETSKGEILKTESILVATGGVRMKQARIPVEQLAHSLLPPTPSLFTFKIDDPRLSKLQGVSVPYAKVRAGNHEASGPLLITHWGLSGPAVLKVSAWGARDLAKIDYHFMFKVNWLGETTAEEVRKVLALERAQHGSRRVLKRCLFEGMTRRLWHRLGLTANIAEDQTWATLTKEQTREFINQLTAAQFQVTGKSLNKDEFVTCGGVPLKEVNLKTMESKRQPGLYFAGEVLDIDGITGGFNFQAAWTTGYLAGQAIGISEVSAD